MSLGTVTVYRSTTGGAPAYSNTAGSLISILDYCLVTGQSWTKTTLATNKAAYTQPSGTNGFTIQVDDTATTTQARVLAWETLSAFNTGTNQTPSATAMTSLTFASNAGLYVDKPTGTYTGGAPWRMFTNGAIFYLFIQWESSNLDGYTGLVFGDLLSYKAGDGFGTIISGKGSSGTIYKPLGSQYVASLTNVSGGATTLVGFTMRPVTQNGTSLQMGWHTDEIILSGSAVSGEMNFACNGNLNTVDGGVQLAPVWISEPVVSQGQFTSYGSRGLVPGVWAMGTWGHPFPEGYVFSGTVYGVSRTFEIVGAQGTNSTPNSGSGQLAIETSNTWGF